MQKYCKILNNKTGLVEVGLGSNIEFYQSIGMELRDVVQSEIDNLWYLAELCPHKSYEEKLEEAKELKIKENDLKRDEKLNAGVIYKEILFDSDTDQKVNLLATVSTLDDDTRIYWYGMDNQALECSKEDLINIGDLIVALHSACWTKNAQIKNAISSATTKTEVEVIEIVY